MVLERTIARRRPYPPDLSHGATARQEDAAFGNESHTMPRMEGQVAPRVLVADDEDSIRLLVTRVLRRVGFETAEADDGQAAIEKIDAQSFDAVVLDLMMPRVDGFGVIDHVIATNPDLMAKIVVVTAFPRTAAEQRLHHVCHILSKPFDPSELIAVVRECAAR
jgi:CheY-like chemotaxis protein